MEIKPQRDPQKPVYPQLVRITSAAVLATATTLGAAAALNAFSPKERGKDAPPAMTGYWVEDQAREQVTAGVIFSPMPVYAPPPPVEPTLPIEIDEPPTGDGKAK